MSIMLAVWLLPVLLACILLLGATHYKRLWPSPVVYAEASLALFIASMPFLLTAPFAVPTKIFLFTVQAWLLLLSARLLFGRLKKPLIFASTWLNCLFGLAALGLVLLGSVLVQALPAIFTGYDWRIMAVLLAVALIQIVFLRQLLWTIRHFILREPAKYVPLKDLPTVSLCIPARNETDTLDACLRAAIASDYPKLEILVLDDCSQDKTSHVIRSFAHSGVRFVQGDVPAEGWLGRNQAMDTLAEQATGDYLLFMGVDTRLGPQSITKFTQYVLQHKLDMVTVLPQNRLGVALGTVLGTLQYFWRIVLPVTGQRVPVSSKFWLISADALRSLGGFASVRQKIVPEGSFARRLFTHDAYRFIVGSEAFGVTTAKRWSSQIETSVRLLYPTCKRQPFFVLGAVLAIAVFIMPFIVLAASTVLGSFDIAFWLSATGAALLLCNYALVLWRTHPHTWLLAVWLLPIALVQEAVLLVVSMLKYEFGTVNWKGRNVCYPVITDPNGQPVLPEQTAKRVL